MKKKERNYNTDAQKEAFKRHIEKHNLVKMSIWVKEEERKGYQKDAEEADMSLTQYVKKKLEKNPQNPAAEENLNIKIINENISEDILNMKLKDMFCKHVIRRNPDSIQSKAGKLYIESCKLGYKVCNWGLHVGHASDIQYHINSIMQMERDGYNSAIRIVVCKYDFCDMPIVWVDNLHSAIKYIREYGKDVKLGDVPFYVVDISDYEHPSIHGSNRSNSSLRENYEDILGAVSCAYKRFRRSNSKELIEIRYTLEDFLYDNPELYTAMNTHLGLINESDDANTILAKSQAFNSLYNTEEYLYGQK